VGSDASDHGSNGTKDSALDLESARSNDSDDFSKDSSEDDVIMDLETAKVASWRDTNGLVLDRDLAFHFSDLDQALYAGNAVANAWWQCRQVENAKGGSDAAHAMQLDYQRKPGKECRAKASILSLRRKNARFAEKGAKLIEPNKVSAKLEAAVKEELADVETAYNESLEALTEFMYLAGCGRAESPSATSEELREHCMRRVGKVLTKASLGGNSQGSGNLR